MDRGAKVGWGLRLVRFGYGCGCRGRLRWGGVSRGEAGRGHGRLWVAGGARVKRGEPVYGVSESVGGAVGFGYVGRVAHVRMFTLGLPSQTRLKRSRAVAERNLVFGGWLTCLGY